MTPDDLLFTKEHEWLRIVGETATIGISDHAQKELGEIVYIELPKPGMKFNSGESFGSVESVKAVSELFIPVSGEIVEINEELGAAPEKNQRRAVWSRLDDSNPAVESGRDRGSHVCRGIRRVRRRRERLTRKMSRSHLVEADEWC